MNFFLVFQNILIVVLVLLSSAFLGLVVSDSFADFMYKHLSGNRYYALQFLGIGMGGVLLALQALMSYKRAKALEDTANAQAEAAKAQAKATEEQAKANQNTEQGQRQERLKNAIEHLGHASDSVRLGGAYELFQLAEETEKWRQTILDILCAHIRQTTGEAEYRKKYKLKPSEEIQSLLTLLFVQEHEVFTGFHINLQGSWLNGADLTGARLGEAFLVGAYLQRANLDEARLQGTNFGGAHLQKARLWEASLQGANLCWAHLQEAHFLRARLQGVDLDQARLQGASLSQASLQGAFLGGVGLQEVNLHEARLQGIRSRAGDWPLPVSFAERIRKFIGQESDLSRVTFKGGLNPQKVDSLVEGFSDEEANELRETLEPHIDQRVSRELPEDSGAITGAYTKEEAEQWIAEYNEAMSEVPTESDN